DRLAEPVGSCRRRAPDAGGLAAALGGARSDGASTDASGCACGAGAELERGEGERRKEPRLLASGAWRMRDDPALAIAAITGRLRKWGNPRLGAAIREDYVPKDCVSERD